MTEEQFDKLTKLLTAIAEDVKEIRKNTEPPKPKPPGKVEETKFI
jgi:hypothetical protein